MAGALMIAGGHIDRSQRTVFQEFIRLSGGRDSRILIVVTASGSEPDQTYRWMDEALTGFGLASSHCSLLPLYRDGVADEAGRNLLTGDAPGIEQYLEGIGGVWFTGGDQYFIRQCFVRKDGSDTRLLLAMREANAKGLVIGGSSAGAAMMSRTMIGEGNNKGMLRRQTLMNYDTYDALCELEDSSPPLLLTTGLGFFPYGVVDQHFDKRPRLLRLVEACFVNPLGQKAGYAVSEDTALVVFDDRMEVLGESCVYLVDCGQATRHEKGVYSGIRFSALQSGDQLKTDGSIQLRQAASAPVSGYRRDFINDGIVNSPVFDPMMIGGLLTAAPENLYQADDDLYPFIKACVAYDTLDTEFFVILRYYKTAQAAGYLGETGKASFCGILMDIEAVTLTASTKKASENPQQARPAR